MSRGKALGWFGPGASALRGGKTGRGRGSKGRRHGASDGLRLEELEPRVLLAAATINWGTQYQTIAGFGASSAWTWGTYTTSQQQLLWSATNGAGMSLLRSHINSDTSASSSEISIMQEAAAMGVTVWSTPWSPPAAWKSNNDVRTIINGVDTMGYLLPSHYQDWANWLKQYVINMQSSGIPIYAVSMQNEPNWSADYESCRWTAQQFAAALPILHDTLAADSRTANVKIILPEEIHWNNLDLVSTIMSSTLNNYTNLIYADHTYGITTVNNNTYPGKDGFTAMSNLYNLNGHQIWETEHTGDDPGQGITAGLNEAQSIYDIVYISQASAYHHWWINSGGGAGLLAGNWQTTKLYSAMAQYSKFIRPGWVAIGESDDNNGLRISAFKNPTTGEFATVVVNTGSSAITETINLNGAYCPVVTPWVTSATLDVAQQQSIPATGNGGSYSYTIPAKSIVTFTGTATTTPVSEVPVGLLAAATSTSAITLSWTSNLASATGYTVQRSTDGTTWTTVNSTIPAGTYTYTDSGLSTNTLYYYRVQANNGTAYSNVCAEMTQPPAPSNLSASYNSSNQNVALSWTGNNYSATQYAVDRSTDNGATWTTVRADLSYTTTSYTDTTAPELATVQYRVRAVYGLNSSATTNVATVATTVLKAPTGFTVTSGSGTMVLKWTDNTTTNATVSIERSLDGTNWNVIATVNHGVQTYTNTGVTEGGAYYYRIRNYYSTATTYSAYATAAPVILGPAAPTHVEVTFSAQPTLLARVLWVDNATTENAYEVDRSTDGGATWGTLTATLPAGSTSYVDTDVTSGQTYTYRVKAWSNGQSSGAVATLAETASALPAPFAHGDIGDAGTLGLAGAASYDAGTSTYTLSGAGADIWGSADGFQYAYTMLTGDGSIVAQVTSMANFANYGKAGLMMRSSLDPGAAYAIAFLTPQGMLNFEQRTSSDASASTVKSQGTFAAPVWLKLTRSGNTYSVYYSTDGTGWTLLGSSTFSIGSTIYVGLITSAHSSSQLATATFANVALTGRGNQVPTVATPAAADPASTTGTTTNLSVGGSDDAGGGNLIYTWVTAGTPPAPVVFSSNGQNDSKNTIATFSQAGDYTFVVTITDQFGLSTTSSVNVTVTQTLTSIAVNPNGAAVAPNSQKQFSLIAYDQFGAVVSNPPGVTWSITNSNLGTINASTGLFTAGSLQGVATIGATVGIRTATATVNVTSLPAPLAWYRMDGGSGSTVTDSSGNSNNGTATGSYNWTSGKMSLALGLSGGYATLPSGFATALQSASNFTISGWVKLSSLNNWARMFDFGTGTNVNMYLAPVNGSGYIQYAITTGGYTAEQRLTSTTALAANTWTFLAVTLAGTTGTLYVNGSAVATNTSMTLNPRSLGTTTQDYLGDSQYSSDPTLQGSIDDMRMYNVGLSGAQITQLFNSYTPPTVATPASANPTTVTGVTSTLAVLGASALGENTLKYTWSTVGTTPAPVTFSVNGTNAAKSTVATFSKAGTYTLRATMADNYGYFSTSDVTVTVNAAIAGRGVYYGGSAFDGTTHDGAIALDKTALLPGQTASFANYTSYSGGLNGLIVDIRNPAGTMTASDFVFQVGNDNTPNGWAAAPDPLSVICRPGAGMGGSTRVEITWADGAIVNQWLRVTVRGGEGSTSGLAANDVFYFGNVPGETGDNATSARVDMVDQLAIRAAATDSASVTAACDINKDGVIDETDEVTARGNITWFLNELQLISVPANAQGLAASVPADLVAVTTPSAASTATTETTVAATDSSSAPMTAQTENQATPMLAMATAPLTTATILAPMEYTAPTTTDVELPKLTMVRRRVEVASVRYASLEGEKKGLVVATRATSMRKADMGDGIWEKGWAVNEW
jgi:O-glycosyl hydrolase/regulation of enolase protein 1 (concanavalin A-like superfamily)